MKKKVLFCNCGGNLLTADYKKEIFKAFQQNEISFISISDLCSFSTMQQEDLSNLLSESDELLVIACYERSVKLLLEKAGISLEKSNFHFLNFLAHDLEGLIREILKFNAEETISAEVKSNSDWPAWFPLIDYSRCSSCGQCADFCLFGVYEKKDNKIVVVNPQGCKNNCPACARICPKTAIIFPKYEHGGAIAGDESINELEEQERQRKDIDAILGSEIYQALERRKMKRQSIIRSSALQQAEEEREKALKEIRNK